LTDKNNDNACCHKHTQVAKIHEDLYCKGISA